MSAALNDYSIDDAVWIEPEPAKPGTLRMRRWRQRNNLRARIQSQVAWHRTRARRHGLIATLTSAEWLAYLERIRYRCLACGVSSDNLSIDHIVPSSRGGTTSLDNLQPLCLPCNRSKGSRIIDYRSNHVETT